MLRTFVAALVLSLMLAACGGGGGDDDTGDTDMSAEEVVLALKDAGLPIGEHIAYDEESDPNDLMGRPDQYIGKANFADTRLDTSTDFDLQGGGSVEVFGNEDDAEKREEYVKSVTGASSLFTEYSFREGSILLRLASELTPAQAEEYEAALKALD